MTIKYSVLSVVCCAVFLPYTTVAIDPSLPGAANTMFNNKPDISLYPATYPAGDCPDMGNMWSSAGLQARSLRFQRNVTPRADLTQCAQNCNLIGYFNFQNWTAYSANTPPASTSCAATYYFTTKSPDLDHVITWSIPEGEDRYKKISTNNAVKGIATAIFSVKEREAVHFQLFFKKPPMPWTWQAEGQVALFTKFGSWCYCTACEHSWHLVFWQNTERTPDGNLYKFLLNSSHGR